MVREKEVKMKLNNQELELIYEALRAWYASVRSTEHEHKIRTGLSPFYNTYSKDILDVLDRIKKQLEQDKDNVKITICRGSEHKSFGSIEKANEYLSNLTKAEK